MYKKRGRDREMAGTMVSGVPLTEEQLRLCCCNSQERTAEAGNFCVYELTEMLRNASDFSCTASFSMSQDN